MLKMTSHSLFPLSDCVPLFKKNDYIFSNNMLFISPCQNTPKQQQCFLKRAETSVGQIVFGGVFCPRFVNTVTVTYHRST